MLLILIPKALINSDITYDSINKRKRTIEEIQFPDQNKNKFDIVELNEQNLQYVYNFKTKTCIKLNVRQPWFTYDVPENSTSLGESYIGSSGTESASVLVTIWKYKFKDQSGNTTEYNGAWTYESCLPVYNIYNSKSQFLNTITKFYNITIGRLIT